MSDPIKTIMEAKPSLTEEEAESLHELARDLAAASDLGGVLMLERGMTTPMSLVIFAGLEALLGDDNA